MKGSWLRKTTTALWGIPCRFFASNVTTNNTITAGASQPHSIVIMTNTLDCYDQHSRTCLRRPLGSIQNVVGVNESVEANSVVSEMKLFSYR